MKSRKRQFRGVLVLGLGASSALIGSGIVAQAAMITAIDFKMTDTTSEVVISSDAPIHYSQTENLETQEAVIHLGDAKLAPSANRKMDTTGFRGSSVSGVIPQRASGSQNAEVLIQLKDRVSPKVTLQGNRLIVSVPNLIPAVPITPVVSVQKLKMSAAAPNDQPSENGLPPGASVAQTIGGSNRSQNPIDQIVESQSTKQFSGKPISLQVKDMDIKDILQLIGETSGFNIVVADGVVGKLTLSLNEVPWDQALDIILRSQKLGADRSANVLRVMSMQKLIDEKSEEQRITALNLATAPRVTKIYPVSYADPSQLQNTLKQFLTVSGQTPGAGTVSQALVQVDTRTNSLIIQDTQDNIEKITKLISILDRQTPQVLIEAKIVEATDVFGSSLGGNIGIGSLAAGSTGAYYASFAGANPLTDLGSGFQPSATPGGDFGLQPSLGFLPGGQAKLNAVLSISESQNNAKILSSPKVVVLNKESANIVQGIPIIIPVTVNTGLGGVQQGIALDSVNISLNVTPQVTNDGSVIMTLSVQRDAATPLGNVTGKSNRSLTTKVMVDSGATLVIGGIYTMDESVNESGFPGLRKIPILGWLFGSSSKTSRRSELFIFITPRILNTEKSQVAQGNTQNNP